MKHAWQAALLIGTATFAHAQDTSQPPASITPGATTAATPTPGETKFSESQARERITEAGFVSITGLTQGQDGIWRGKGTRGGDEHDVKLDHLGNVFPK